MAIGYGKTDFLGYGKKKPGYGSRHTPYPEMTPLVNITIIIREHLQITKLRNFWGN